MTTTPSTRNNIISRYSVAVFFILAMVLGGGMVYLVVMSGLPGSLALSSALSASIAGVIMTAVEDGKTGLKLMLRRLLIWRVAIGYWLFALLFLVPAILLGSLVNPLFNGDLMDFEGLRLGIDILPMFVGFVLLAGVGQELGWTGFLMPRLQARYSALTSCVIRTILVAIWHLPLLFYSITQPDLFADLQYASWIAQKGFGVAFTTMILMFMLPWSVFYTWMFNNTRGSLLLVAILHGSEIWLAYLFVNAGIDPSNLDNYWGYGGVLVLVAIMIVLTTGAQNLSRKLDRIVNQLPRG